MRKFFCWIGVCIGLSEGLAQVGINTVDPKAQLDIHSTNAQNPTITDGILIPRIANFPSQRPTVAQEGMLVYLITPKQDFPVGFYYWNHTTEKWLSITADAPTEFFGQGTSRPATGITEGIYRMGNIGIGAESPEVRLKVALGPETEHSIRTALEVDNFSAAPENVTYGILSNNRSITNGRKYGIKSNVSAAGRGMHYGVYNEVYQGTAEDIFGIYNKVGRTYGVANNHYGLYSEIGTAQGAGFVYGLYSSAMGADAKKVFAGFFAGRLGIGGSSESSYVFPTDRGAEGQLMALDSEGTLHWKDPDLKTYTSTGTATGVYAIPKDTYTLQVNNAVSSITLPDSSLHQGRIIILLGWNGITAKTFNFLSGDDIWDIATGSRITTISGGERIAIQSTGIRWVVISRQ